MTTIITIDGPSGSGKGTIARLLAKKLGYHLLDSGVMYRLLGLAVRRRGVDFDNHAAVEALAQHLDINFKDGQVFLEGENVTNEIRTEASGADASRVAVIPEVRIALLDRQRAFARDPGLVADGRDMGTVVFPEAQVKIYLTASAETRAERRFLQLRQQGESVTLRALVDQVKERDKRDMGRDVSPLMAAPDSVEIDSSELSVEEVLDAVLSVAYYRGVATSGAR